MHSGLLFFSLYFHIIFSPRWAWPFSWNHTISMKMNLKYMSPAQPPLWSFTTVYLTIYMFSQLKWVTSILKFTWPECNCPLKSFSTFSSLVTEPIFHPGLQSRNMGDMLNALLLLTTPAPIHSESTSLLPATFTVHLVRLSLVNLPATSLL